MKNKQNGYYLLIDDIKELNDRYGKLYKQIANDFSNKEISKNQIDEACNVLLNKYKFEINELNDLREAEYKTRKAEIEAKNDEQIPWRRGWWWRLILKPLTNRAQDIIEERAALEADNLFSSEENALEAHAVKIYGKSAKKLSKRKRRKAFKKYLKLKKLLDIDSASAQAAPADVPAEPPTRKPRKNKKSEG